MLESTVPKRVQPPRLLTVLLVSGVTLALTLFGYSTTQIYLRFSEPPMDQGSAPGSGTSDRIDPTESAGTGTSAPGPGASAGPGDDTKDGSGTDAPIISTVSYQTVESSGTAFTGEVTVTNTSDSVLDGWELALGFADAEVTSAWNVDWEPTQDGIIARQPAGAAGLAPGETVTVGFTAEGTAQSPTSCLLNGRSCDL